MITDRELEFKERLRALSNDARQCAMFAYTELTMNHAAADPLVLEKLQAHAGFWNGIRASLQTSAFLALGRMFDNDRGSHNAKALLHFAQTWTGLFRRDALEARKRAAGVDPAIAARFVQDAYELRPGGLQLLMDEYDKHASYYRKKIEPIRNQVFAHAGYLTGAERDGLFTALLVREFEKIIVFCLQLERCMWQLYENGREPKLESAQTSLLEIVKQLPARGSGGTNWEHFHAVGNANAFFAWLKSTSGDLRGS